MIVAGTGSEDHRLVDAFAAGEPPEEQRGHVDALAPAPDEQLGRGAARRRRVHDAVARESRDDEEAGHAGDGAEDGVVVRRDLVEPGPAPLDVEAGLADGGKARVERLGDPEREVGIEGGVEARRLVRVRVRDRGRGSPRGGSGRRCRRRSSSESPGEAPCTGPLMRR